MAHLIQANIMISDHGDAGYRCFGTIHFQMGENVYAYDLDVFKPLRTGDPKINGQLEELIIKLAEEIYRDEKGGYKQHTRFVETHL